eukprot:scaffold293429_cov27-Tisochrysis_lutea.AAC.4
MPTCAVSARAWALPVRCTPGSKSGPMFGGTCGRSGGRALDYSHLPIGWVAAGDMRACPQLNRATVTVTTECVPSRPSATRWCPLGSEL